MQQQETQKQDESKKTASQLYEELIQSTDEVKVETLASLFFTTQQIAAFIGMNFDDLMNIVNFEPDNPLTKAYQRGKMKTEILLRFDNLKFALSGSPQAVADMKEYLIKQNISEHEE